MTTRPTLAVIAALAVAGLCRSAAAQPSTAPESSSEPPRGRLSHINGTPVQVGDHNQYYYEFKRWNVASNPIGWIAGFYGLSVSYGFNDHIAVRADANLFSIIDSDKGGYELGLGLPLYLRRTYSGPFLEPGVIIRQFGTDSGEDGFELDDDRPTFGPQMLLGWHWMFDSGLNAAIAIGGGRNLATRDDDDYHYDDEELFVNGYLRIGYAF